MPRLALTLVVFAFCHACASYTDSTREIRDAYMAGRYSDADKILDESPLKDQNRNRLLYLLEKGVITDRLDSRSKSRLLLLDADKLADRLQTVSVSSEAATYVYNESIQDYPGEDYEKVAIHSLLALSFLQDRDYVATRVEARKINTKLDEINGKYDKDSKNRYTADAFALYLSGSIYESLGEWDNAIIDYKKSIAVYDKLYSKEFGVSAPLQLLNAFYAVAKKRGRADDIKSLNTRTDFDLKKIENTQDPQGNFGEVLLFHEFGAVTPKVANDFFIPFGGQLVRLSFPVIRPRSLSSDGGISVYVKDDSNHRKTFHPELLQNHESIASKTLDDRRLRLILKQGARLLVKGQLTDQANRNFGPIAGIAANIYSAVTETADTRGWTLLPSGFYATRFKLSPGKHTVVVAYPGGRETIHNIDIAPGKLVLLRTRP